MSHGERRLRERNRDRSGGVGGFWGQGGLKKQGLEFQLETKVTGAKVTGEKVVVSGIRGPDTVEVERVAAKVDGGKTQ